MDAMNNPQKNRSGDTDNYLPPAACFKNPSFFHLHAPKKRVSEVFRKNKKGCVIIPDENIT